MRLTHPGVSDGLMAESEAPPPPPGIWNDQLDNWFTYHPPRPGDLSKFQAIRESALAFAQVVVANTPAGPDQSAAIRKVREAVMTANAAIACGGK